jgi:signal transduction histidine kinase
MQHRNRNIIIALLLIAGIVMAGCTRPDGPGAGSPDTTSAPVTTTLPVPPAGSTPSTEQVIAYVDAAAAYARGAGKDKAIAEFNNPQSPWNQGALYIFSEDKDGNALAEPFEHGIVGTNILSMRDAYGIPLVENLVDTGMKGRGLVSYNYPNPARNATIEPKVSYVVNIDPTCYIGAGTYENLGTTFPAAGMKEQPAVSRDELVAFVTEAAFYARQNGRETAVAAFSNASGPFMKGELYIIGYDYDEKNIVQPLAPYLRDLILTHYTDKDAVATIAQLADVASQGGGFAHTTQKIPVNGRWVFAPKLHYVVPVDGTWWVSASVLNPDYTQLRSGNLTGVPLRVFAIRDLVAKVSQAVNYTRENGRQKALAGIGSSNGIFAGDIAIWAEGADGTLLADPARKDLVGRNLRDATDAYGEKTTLTGMSSVTNGTGFVHAMVTTTKTGSARPSPSLVYRKKVDDTWWICGSLTGIEVR